jgi:hypothetical protein
MEHLWRLYSRLAAVGGTADILKLLAVALCCLKLFVCFIDMSKHWRRLIFLLLFV